ncbi:MAG: PilZ domain-containing protein [Candidatus Omnitrophota bacterium]|nr:PilZ domain-containing protein [Candidatus Omnitrophota bacterium]
MSWDGFNRRRFPRLLYPCLVKVTTSHGAEQNAFLTHTENIGVGGICIIAKREIPLLAPVQIEVDLLEEADHLFARGRVAWIVQRKALESVKPLFYDIGIGFEGLAAKDKARLEATVARFIKKGYKILKPVY